MLLYSQRGTTVIQGRIFVATFSFVLATQVLNAADFESVPGEFLVKIKKQFLLQNKTKNFYEESLNAHVKNQINTFQLLVVQRPVFELPSASIELLQKNEMVEYVEPNYIFHAEKTPNDSDYSKLWGMRNVGQADSEGQNGKPGIDIDAERAWDIETGNGEVS